jgi:hypothetical protein
VGSDRNQTQALALHWNGKKWQVQPSQSGELAGVSVGSAAEVWAVGDVSSGAVTKTLFVHCTSCDREA